MVDTPRVIVTAHDGAIVGDLDPAKLAGLVAISEVNGENAMTVTTTQELAKGDRLLWRDGMGYWHEYVIESDECAHDMPSNPMHAYYAVWSIQHDLSATITTAMPGTGGTPASATVALQGALEGTGRWVVGAVDVATTGSASFWRKSGWEAMQALVETWGGELRATVEVGATGVTARRVDLLQHVGGTTATRRYDYGHDATGVTRTIEDQLWTARVMPLGAAQETESGGYGRKLTIESVNGGIAWLEDADAVPLTRVPDGSGGWEVPVQVVENGEIEDAAALKAWALANLKTWTTPKVSYEVEVVQLDGAGESALGVALGDECAVVDATFGEGGLRLSARVLRIEQDLLDPTQTTLTISNLRTALGDQLASLSRATSEVRDMVEGMSAAQSSTEWVQNLLARINADANATGGYTYITEGQGIRTYDVAVTDPLVGAEASAVCEIKGGTMRIANTRDSAGQWEWKTVFQSGRILAELIDAIGASSGFHAQLTATGLDVYDGSTLLAHFGADTSIGPAGGLHLTMDETGGVVFWDGQTRLSGFDASGYNYGWRNDLGQPIVRTNVYDNTDVGYPFGAITIAGSTEAFTDSELGWECERALSTDGKYVRAQLHVASEGANGGPAVTARVRHGDVDGALKLECYQIGTSEPVIDLYAAIDTVTLYDRKSGVYSQAFPTHGVVAQGTNVPANGYHDFTVSFGHTYAAAPTVQLTILSTSTATTFNCDIYLRSVSPTGFTARIVNREGSDRSPGFHWFAIG